MTREKTVGQISTELKEKASDNTHTAIDQMREQLSDYEANVIDTVNEGKKKFEGNFYVVVLTKKERLMDNVIRLYFFVRISCPTPEYDQVVYRYDRKDDRLDFLWVVPSKHTCEMYKAHPLEVPKEEKMLFNFVLDFEDGTLTKKVMAYNNEFELQHAFIK